MVNVDEIGIAIRNISDNAADIVIAFDISFVVGVDDI